MCEDAELKALNAICPYFTMFPLEFPLSILSLRARKGERVLDPFCGRGTTNFAARLLGLSNLGVDASPVATAITAAKLVSVDPADVLNEAKSILRAKRSIETPNGEFWAWAYQENVLDAVCRLRNALLEDCSTPERIALRGIILGALHGPKNRHQRSYFSNQCPRTYAPKPAYAVRFWKKHRLRPEPIDVLDVLYTRARRYYSGMLSGISGEARLADSRTAGALAPSVGQRRFSWIITSPPYYGMNTYLPDQWIRLWFVGGSEAVNYINPNQLQHRSPAKFVDDLKSVWRRASTVCTETATLVIRFGGIADRAASPREIIQTSLQGSGWRISTIKSAGDASNGRRQADTFLKAKSKPIQEWVVWGRPVSR
jgi:hypothetical protein